MSEQKTISQAVKEEFSGPDALASNMIRQLQTNFETQHVLRGFPRSYIGIPQYAGSQTEYRAGLPAHVCQGVQPGRR